MKETQHTPGPWMFRDCKDAAHRYIFSADGKSGIAKMITRIHECGTEYTKEMRANAALIAAAPEMYEALKLMDKSLNGSPFDTMGMLAAHRAVAAALARVEGKESSNV